MWGRSDSPYGCCSLQWSKRGSVSKLYFTDQIEVEDERDDAAAAALGAKIFSGEQVEISLRGSELEIAVWTELCNIERGETCTYSQIAEAIGRPRAVRAVASAIGRNPISYIVPCHRVLRKDGTLGGYRWGVEIKKQILANEKQDQAK